MVGRLADAVVLSEDERRFLEGQVRRHKAARSLSDRCRMILLCADGLASKEVAAGLGCMNTQSANGADVLCAAGLKVSPTNTAPVARAPCRTIR